MLQVGLDRNEIDEPLAGLLSALALAGPLAPLLAAAGGYLLAGRALAPVTAITDLAARVGASDLGARLDLAVIREQYLPLAEEKGVTLRTETVPAPLVADEDLLVQLLVNLLDNALAHTPAGGAVTIGCRPEDGEIRLWVADTGEGIAAEHVSRVCDRFYRVDVGRARARGGTGLGLAICEAIAEAHGGSISLSSAPGRGTRFEVALPVGR